MSFQYAKKMPANTKMKPPKHWTQRVHEVVISRTTDGSLNFAIRGGADNGQFPYIADIKHDKILVRSGKLSNDDVVLEVNGYRISGYTLWDIHGLVSYIDDKPLVMKTVKPGQHLTRDLRRYLNTRFQKGSTDHDLQQTIRDNLYLRTVPCTTRPPRNGELNGIDYTFLTVDEFIALEKSGNLLESGLFDGNHYGTPKPPKEPPSNLEPSFPAVEVPAPTSVSSDVIKPSAAAPTGDVIKPGAHPSSKGKRERNKSSILATQNLQFIDDDDENDDIEERRRKEIERLEKELGPLPDTWEIAFTEQSDMYFIDHITETTQWLDPRLERVQKQALLDCADDELPYGWEKIEDPQYGSYYIDHINRKTQYENPVVQAKREAKEAEQQEEQVGQQQQQQQQMQSEEDAEDETDGRPPWQIHNANEPRDTPERTAQQEPVVVQSQTLPRPPKKPMVALPRTNSEGNIAPNSTVFFTGPDRSAQKPFFTKNPAELNGEPVKTVLTKSSRGFGFTIVGGDEPQEFLQIKSVVPNGPAHEDGKLQTGDVLVYVNDTLVLGYTHQDVVTLFQSIPPGEGVLLQVCRGYPLPFDPDDPNAQVVLRNPSQLPVTSRASVPQVASAGYGGGGRTANIRKSYENGSVGGTTPLWNHVQQQPESEQQAQAPRDTPSSKYRDPQLQADRSVLIRDSPVQYRETQQQAPRDNLLLQRGDVHTPQDIAMQRRDTTPQNQPLSKPELFTINIVKGALGFGFTIADSTYGQKVKQILDEPRCKNLAEGDVLMQINNYNLRNLHHNEVVNVLKKCPKGISAAITIQRGGMLQTPPSQRRNFPSESYFPREATGSDSVDRSGSGSVTPMFYQASAVRTPSMSSNASKLTAPSISERTEGQPAYRVGRTMSAHTNTNAQEKPYRNPSPLKIQLPSTNAVDSRPPSRTAQPILKTSQESVFETTVFLKRQESGFGFRIVGGHEEGSQVSVGAIIPGGAADVDGRLRSGDEIMYVDGHSVVGSSHHKVVSMMGNAALAGRVSLGIRRRTRQRPAADSDNRGTLPRSKSVTQQYPYDVTVSRREDEGFGFVIISATNRSGSTIGRIIEHSPAERCGKLHVGDNLMAVNGLNIMNTHHSDVVNIIKDSGYSVTLTIAAPDDVSSGSSSPRSSEHMLNAMALPAQINDGDHLSHPQNATRSQQQQHEQARPVKSPDPRMPDVSGYPRNPAVNYNDAYGGRSTLDRRSQRERQQQPADPQYGTNRRYPENVPNNVDRNKPEEIRLGEGFYTASVLKSPTLTQKNKPKTPTSTENHRAPGHKDDRFAQKSPKEPFYRASPNDRKDKVMSPNNYFQFNDHGEPRGPAYQQHQQPQQKPSYQTFKDYDPPNRTQTDMHGRPNEQPYRERLPSTGRAQSGGGYTDTWQREILEKHKAEIRRKEENQRMAQEQHHSPQHAVQPAVHYSPKRNVYQPSPYSPKHTRHAIYAQKSSSSLDYYNVELLKGPKGFGFSIRGGKEFNDMPLFVLKIAEDGPAAVDSKLRVGDQIMEINGYRTTGMKHSEAIDIIKRGGGVVRILVKRGQSPSSTSGYGDDMINAVTSPLNYASPYMK